ncbi:arabinose efflux permease family protein [Brevibacillus borstelensis AK1]|uniref:Arabinose efflux permease family protein n=1 Tax=Brevibacillus borstelensis AK1 TaxID=1300222 RepID=M8DVV1_9BACL|nr:MFS transporter [Brevibacillus borstelensis]EMT51106.1 arabinose efflux permease family protein [Brevibacillus borstelensis AK1]KKX52820.1 arabinose ABC transporter permease [Brevibacillus borstelensis cifa_chp40]
MNPSRTKGLALFILAISQLILALDYTIIFVAMPSLGNELGFSTNHLQWVVSAYSLAFGGFLLIGGRLSDLLGRRRMFIIAMALFVLGSLLGGLANTQLLLIIARGLQGLGGALLSPSTLSLIMSNFNEGNERNRALGIWAAMGGVGLSLGLLLGGVLTSYVGWEATFFVNVPIGLLVIILAPVVLVESKISSQTKHFDVAGTIFVTAGMLLVVYYLVQSPVDGWLSMRTLPFVIVGAAFLVAFLVIEKRAQEPLLSFRLLRNRNLTGATLTAFLFSASFGTLYYFLTLYTQGVLHFSAIQSGLSFLPLTLSAFLGARLINKMLASTGVAGTIATGMGLGMIGFLLLTQLSETGSTWGIIPGTIIIGLGQAFVFTTMFIAGSTGIDLKEQGVASAIISTGQQIGGAIGLAVIMAILSASLGSSATLESLLPTDLNQSIHTAFILSAVITLLGIIVAFMTLKQKSRRKSNATQ